MVWKEVTEFKEKNGRDSCKASLYRVPQRLRNKLLQSGSERPRMQEL
jgi:hypothetical protein